MKIAIIKIFKESFKDVREHKLEWVRVATAPIIVWLFGLIFMSLMYWSADRPLWFLESIIARLEGTQNVEELSLTIIFGNVVYYITYFIALLSIMINGYRYGVMREGGNRWWTLNLGWRFVKVILYSILVIIMASIYATIAAGIVIGAQAYIESIVLTVVLGVLFAIFGFYWIIRIGLTLLLVAIDRNQPMRISWRLLKGNVLRLIGLMILIVIVIGLIGLAGVIVLGILGWILSFINPWLVGIAVVLGFLFAFFMWLLNWAVSAKALALVYKTFTEGKAF